MKKLNKKGFTLIELLVVIAIIGLLSTMAVIALGNARAKARDAKRQSDAKIFQTAVELYVSDNGNPPNAPAAAAGAWDTTLAGLLVTYLPGGLPEDPLPTGRIWCYCEDGTQYLIATSLEQTIANIAGDLDSVAATVAGAYSYVGGDCICSDDAIPSDIDCQDNDLGSVDSDDTVTTFCLGSTN